jgi:hypothetical protein
LCSNRYRLFSVVCHSPLARARLVRSLVHALQYTASICYDHIRSLQKPKYPGPALP